MNSVVWHTILRCIGIVSAAMIAGVFWADEMMGPVWTKDPMATLALVVSYVMLVGVGVLFVLTIPQPKPTKKKRYEIVIAQRASGEFSGYVFTDCGPWDIVTQSPNDAVLAVARKLYPDEVEGLTPSSLIEWVKQNAVIYYNPEVRS